MYTLTEWLEKIGKAHPCEIDLGLTRVHAVAHRLGLLLSPCAVITVAGTNGKGSTAFALEAIFRAAGYQTGLYTSPVIRRHNEQVRINGKEVADERFCSAFDQIEVARKEISLTPFEYHTLAALLIMKSAILDIWILEVGMGGRLDAVNLLDADVAIVTSIGLDHQQWLGETREEIGFEKAGIFRAERPAICGDPKPPSSLIEHAKKISAKLYCQGKEFSYTENDADYSKTDGWSWQTNEKRLTDLPKPNLYLQNLSAALMAIDLLQHRLPVTLAAIKKGLQTVDIVGRIQIMPGDITYIHDVAHNPDAVLLLAKRISELKMNGKKLAVFSMLTDKNITECIKIISPLIDEWFVAPLQTKRAATENQLRDAFTKATVTKVNYFVTIEKANQEARDQAKQGDSIIIFGSFHVLSAI